MVRERRVWQVVGGLGKGGVLVRSGKDLSSPELPRRLSCGALVAELDHEEGRLGYKLISGTGPDHGWVSTKFQDKQLLVPTDDTFEIRANPLESKEAKVTRPPAHNNLHSTPVQKEHTESFRPAAPSPVQPLQPRKDVLENIVYTTEKARQDLLETRRALDREDAMSNTEEAHTESRVPEVKEGQAKGEPPSHGLSTGVTVRMEGLIAAARFNGQLATVEAWDEEVGRWQVHVSLTGEIVKVKAENLIVEDRSQSRKSMPGEQARSPSVKPQETSQTEKGLTPVGTDGAPAFQKGDLVSIQGLSSASAAPFNGCECTCDDWDAGAGRWIVRVHRDGSFKKVKPENLKIEIQLVAHVVGSNGLDLHVDVSREWQVYQIKEQIQRLAKDVSIEQQRLFFNDAELDDDRRVVDMFGQVSENASSLQLTLIRKPVLKAVDRDAVFDSGADDMPNMVSARQPVAFNTFSTMPVHLRKRAKAAAKGYPGGLRSVTSGSRGQIPQGSDARRTDYSSAWGSGS